MKPQAA